MIEMRWVPPTMANSLSSDAMVTDDDSLRVLQYRYQISAAESGNTYSLEKGVLWSEWIDVTTVTDSKS